MTTRFQKDLVERARLEKRKIVIVGVGALGSHVAMLLRNEAELKVIDFDRVEQKNTLAQFHTKTAVGQNKARALKQLMDFAWGVKVESIPHKLIKENVVELLKGADLVIDCLDNGAGRRAVQDFTLRYLNPATGSPHVACLHGALAADGAFGRVLWDEDFTVDDETAGQATCEGGEFLPFIAIVAAHIARSAQLFLKDGKKVGWTVSPAGSMRI